MNDHNPETTGSPPPLNPLGTEEGVTLLARQRRNTLILWCITILLVLIAAGVFLVLPDYVKPPAPPEPAQQIAINPAGPSAPGGTAQALSPFEEAQRLRQREEAQAILSRLLDVQQALDDKDVTAWAADEYATALNLASAGDAAYREQSYQAATEQYQQALAKLEALEGGIPGLLESLLAEGEQALNTGNSPAALNSFEKALAVDPGSDAAIAGIERAGVLDEVLELIRQAETAAQNGDLDTASELYRSAQTLDAQNTQAAEGLAAMSAAIDEQSFRQQMGRGYAALQNDNPRQALSLFDQALKMRPGSSEATTAIDQVNDQIATANITRHMREASNYRQSEQWQQALDAWQAALDIDPALAEAQAGLAEAESRLNLDNYMQSLLADPLGLADPAVYERSIEVYTNALRIPNGGPRLRDQMSKAKNFLEQSRIPVNVTLRSDGETVVNLLRGENLGQFSQLTVALTPGRYAATGFRTGYRDVRVEFEVGFDTPPPAVTVAATESIR